MPETILDQQEAFIQSLLPHTIFEGWSEEAVRLAAHDLEKPAAYFELLFPEGMTEAISCFYHMIDRKLPEALANSALNQLKIRQRIALLIRTYFELLKPHKEAVRRSIGWLVVHGKPITASKTLWHTVDLMWHLAGDTSTDYNYYTKRTLLAGVYVSTLLFWLDDHSENAEESWAFLDRRIANVMTIGKLKLGSPKDIIKHIPFLRVLAARLHK